MKLVFSKINWNKLEELLNKLYQINFFINLKINSIFFVIKVIIFLFFNAFYHLSALAQLRTSSLLNIDAKNGVLAVKYSNIKRIEEDRIIIDSKNQFWSSENLLGLSYDYKKITALFEPLDNEESTLKLIYLSSDRIPRLEDKIKIVNLQDGKADQIAGSTLLWRQNRFRRNQAQKYLPLFSQGSLIGDTAHSLLKSELHFNTLGSLSFGLTDWLTTSVNLPATALGSPNLRFKSNFYNKGAQSWAFATSVAQERKSDQRLVNIDLIWDSVLTESLIAHSMLSIAVISFDEASGVAAIRSYGSSTIQTGYEILMNDWNRILVGPTFNVDTQAVGGYLSYLSFYKNLLIQFSITSNNLRVPKFSSEEGYLPYLEFAWRW
jgi:hypothetical protein